MEPDQPRPATSIRFVFIYSYLFTYLFRCSFIMYSLQVTDPTEENALAMWNNIEAVGNYIIIVIINIIVLFCLFILIFVYSFPTSLGVRNNSDLSGRVVFLSTSKSVLNQRCCAFFSIIRPHCAPSAAQTLRVTLSD